MLQPIFLQKTDLACRISDDLFGMNMEPTRCTVWQGLSAQMLNNRKFFACQNGGFSGWQATGNVTVCEEREKSTCKSRFPLLNSGELSQIGDALTALNGKEYELRFSVESESNATFTVCWQGVFEESFRLSAGKTAKTVYFTAKGNGAAPFCISTRGKVAVYCLSLQPADHFHGMRRDVLELFRQMRPSLLRFPGGCYAEAYPWKEGLLPPDERPPVVTDLYEGDFLQRNTYGYDCHEIGTDEFMRLCDFVGAKPVLTLPIIREKPSEVLDWVEYCNGSAKTPFGRKRVQRGFQSPFSVQTFFIGNEVYFFGEDLIDDPESAGKRTAQMAQAIASRSENVRCVAGCSPYRTEWSMRALKAENGACGLLSHHFYFTNEFDANHQTYTVAEALAVEQRFSEDLQATISIGKSVGRTVPKISLDEWGFDWGERSSTLSAAVDVILMHTVLKSAAQKQIEQAFYFHPLNEGILKISPTAAEWDCFGKAWQLLSAHRGGVYFQPSVPSKISAAGSLHEAHAVVTLVNTDAEKTVSLAPADCRLQVVTVLEPTELSVTCNTYKVQTYRENLQSVVLVPGAIAQLIFER